ncbi:MAG: hypothetical protein PHP08_00790 [Candidatus Dojkabacteria bacterium]|nr:hypothetical protein [Candidatus Dojkabacteria bacterium]
MDIYKARELQKELFKKSESEHKKMRVVSSVSDDAKIAYAVVHHITDNRGMCIDSNIIGRFQKDVEMGVLVSIHFLSIEEKIYKFLTDPAGIYIVELIEID